MCVCGAGRAICKLIGAGEASGRASNGADHIKMFGEYCCSTRSLLSHLQVDHSLTLARSQPGQYLVARRRRREKSVGGRPPFYFVTRTHAGFIKRRTSRCFSPALSKRRLLIPPSSCWRNRRRPRSKRSERAPPLLLSRDDERPALWPQFSHSPHWLLAPP